jgi:amidase
MMWRRQSSMFNDYEKYDAVGLSGLIRAKEVTAFDVLEAAIAKAEMINPTINAITRTLYESARAVVQHPVEGFFAGVPFLIKDLGLSIKGVPTSHGSCYFQNAVLNYDSTLVARYKQAGLTIFGKTNTAELGLDVTTESPWLGPCLNPLNVLYSSGGSSGGAAAAVAAGIVPAAHASDGGGSIRIPASCCGVFGFKPSRGVMPCGPDRGEGWVGLSTSHVITRTVRDSAALFDRTQGYETGAPYAAPTFQKTAMQALLEPLDPLRIAIMIDAPAPFSTHLDCQAAAMSAAKLCETLGHHVEYAQPKFDIGELMDAIYVIICVNTRNVLNTAVSVSGRAVSPENISRTTWALFQYGSRYTAEDYVAAVDRIHRHGREFAYFFQQYDVLLTPTLAQPPAKIGALQYYPDAYSDIKAFHFDVDTRYTPFTAMYNASGQPAMSVPLCKNNDGLPIGVQFAAAFGDDIRLFQLAQQLMIGAKV